MRTPTNHLVRPLGHVPAALVAVSLLVALAAGCGGGTPAGSDSKPAAESAPPAATTPPVAEPAAPAAPADPAALGAKVFATRCALCHGAEGRGDGVGAKGLKPAPRNFHDQAYMATRTDAQLLEVIHKGKGAGMPKWEGLLSEAEIAAVLQHVRKLGEKP